ncbi:uncharacterized protein [Triticum aestivum]|uniref:uncharacterized protein isoform X1 n=1 Tax=Triticum aestivum TaxID=4565 RepID=UPI001D00403F|nr:uncharacterized protein LOC123059940 isoform X1 [Triticum aestivum]
MGIGYRARARAPIFHLLFVITGAATIDWIFTPSEDVPSVDGQLTVARAFRDMSCYSYTEPLFSYLGADRKDLGAGNVGLRRKEDVRGQLVGVLQPQLIRVCCLFDPTLPSAGPGEGNEDAHPRPRP